MKLGRIGVALMLAVTLGMSGCAGTTVTPAEVVNDVACVAALANAGISIAAGASLAEAIAIITSQNSGVVQACASVLASLFGSVNAQIKQQKADYAKTHAAAGPGRKQVVPVRVK